MAERVIYKEVLPEVHGEKRDISMPEGAEIIRVADQNGPVCMWYLGAPNGKLVMRKFVTIWTGHRFDTDGLTYVGTAQGQHLVCHVFEVVK
jgi:hypothetical protein